MRALAPPEITIRDIYASIWPFVGVMLLALILGNLIGRGLRLQKTLEKLGKELGGLRGRLNNPKFAESAPEEVVEETRANLALREEEEGKLKEALARLAELG